MISSHHSATVSDSIPSSWDREFVQQQLQKTIESVEFWKRSYGFWIEIRSGLRRDGNLVGAAETRVNVANCIDVIDQEQKRLAYWAFILSQF